MIYDDKYNLNELEETLESLRDHLRDYNSESDQKYYNMD